MMRYLLKSGVLCEEKGTKILSRIKHTIWCTSKTVTLSDDTPILKITIRDPDTSEDKRGNKRFREYVMLDRNDTLIAVGYPAYAEGEDPDRNGWPICRMPRVDHAIVQIAEATFLLTMHDNRHYSLEDRDGQKILQITHMGLSGGWLLEDEYDFRPELLNGLFVFCRFIEQENEFMIV